jgi:hypothetical protein
MNRRVVTVTISGVAIAAASLGTAFALPSHPSTKHGALMFTATNVSHRSFKTHYIDGDKDVSSGHTIGIDTIQCIVESKTMAKCDVAASFRRGILYGNFTQNLKDGTLAGKVTGGTRFFDGATGTIKGQPVGQTQEKVTVTYDAP